MRGKQTIIINGRHYDALTGMPVDDPKEPAKAKATVPAEQKIEVSTKPAPRKIERSPAKPARNAPHNSMTLRRDIVAKPAPKHVASKPQRERVHVTKSPLVNKFAPHPEGAIKNTQPTKIAVSTVSPVVKKAQHQATVHKATHKPAQSSRDFKDSLIKQKLAEAPTKHAPHKPKKTKAPLRISSVMAACLGIMVLGGYLSYINMPNLSVRVAAAQAGIDANYPSYTPSGYRFDGPVSYSNGQVNLAFRSNGSNAEYQINQQKSNWDSQALLDNYVMAQTDDYSVNDTQGLTVYTYDNNAAWVNRGVLYTITGDAPLRPEQVVHIATSL